MTHKTAIARLDRGTLDRFYTEILRTTMQLVRLRRTLGDDGEDLRSDILDDIRRALTGDEPTLEWIDVEGKPEPQLCQTTDGLYREVFDEFGVDRSDQSIQETAYELVRAVLVEVLGDPMPRGPA